MSERNIEDLAKAIDYLYKRAGYPKPKIIECPDPLNQQFIVNAMQQVDLEASNMIKMMRKQEKEENINFQIAQVTMSFEEFTADVNSELQGVRDSIKQGIRTGASLGISVTNSPGSQVAGKKSEDVDYFDPGVICNYADKFNIKRGNEILDILLDNPIWDTVFMEKHCYICEMPEIHDREEIRWKNGFRIEKETRSIFE